MARFKEKVNCTNPACGQSAEIEFTEATRKLRFTCLSCGQLNQVEIILSTDQGGAAGRYGLPENGAKRKIVVVPGEG
jgi:transcription elongation factor Elf1